MRDAVNIVDLPTLSAHVTRRGFVVAGTLAVGLVAITEAASTSSAIAVSVGESRFMTVSRLLISHRLEPAVGRRLAAGLRADTPPLSKHIDALIALARSRGAAIVEDFFPQATFAQQASALKIISAWYLGVVDDRPGGQVFAYELALMFQPTSDVMTIPTYAISGPNAWGPAAPPLDAMPAF